MTPINNNINIKTFDCRYIGNRKKADFGFFFRVKSFFTCVGMLFSGGSKNKLNKHFNIFRYGKISVLDEEKLDYVKKTKKIFSSKIDSSKKEENINKKQLINENIYDKNADKKNETMVLLRHLISKKPNTEKLLYSIAKLGSKNPREKYYSRKEYIKELNERTGVDKEEIVMIMNDLSRMNSSLIRSKGNGNIYISRSLVKASEELNQKLIEEEEDRIHDQLILKYSRKEYIKELNKRTGIDKEEIGEIIDGRLSENSNRSRVIKEAEKLNQELVEKEVEDLISKKPETKKILSNIARLGNSYSREEYINKLNQYTGVDKEEIGEIIDRLPIKKEENGDIYISRSLIKAAKKINQELIKKEDRKNGNYMSNFQKV